MKGPEITGAAFRKHLVAQGADAQERGLGLAGFALKS